MKLSKSEEKRNKRYELKMKEKVNWTTEARVITTYYDFPWVIVYRIRAASLQLATSSSTHPFRPPWMASPRPEPIPPKLAWYW